MPVRDPMFPSLCQGRSTSQELPDDKRNGKLGVQVLCQSYRMGLPACCLCQAYELIRADDPNAVALPIRLECPQCLKHENDIRAVREAEIAQAAREQVREAFIQQSIQSVEIYSRHSVSGIRASADEASRYSQYRPSGLRVELYTSRCFPHSLAGVRQGSHPQNAPKLDKRGILLSTRPDQHRCQL